MEVNDLGLKMDEPLRRKFLKQFAVLSTGIGTIWLTGFDAHAQYENLPMYGPMPIDADSPDELGNLYIRSVMGRELVLYNRNKRLKIIEGMSTPYRVNIKRAVQEENELEIFKFWDIKGSLANPSSSEIFKRWSVNLPSEVSEIPNYIWIIDRSSTKDCGELVLNYNPDSEIMVNVKLGTHTEQVIAGRPIHLGLTFGDYVIEYHYWRGNSPKTGERIELGNITTEMVNGEEVPIRVNLNSENRKVERTIPKWEG